MSCLFTSESIQSIESSATKECPHCLGLRIHCGNLPRIYCFLPFALALNKPNFEYPTLLPPRQTFLTPSSLWKDTMEASLPYDEEDMVLEPSHPRFSTLRCPVRHTRFVIRAGEVLDKR